MIRPITKKAPLLPPGAPPPPPLPAVPVLLRVPVAGKFVRDPRSTYTTSYTHAAAGLVA